MLVTTFTLTKLGMVCVLDLALLTGCLCACIPPGPASSMSSHGPLSHAPNHATVRRVAVWPACGQCRVKFRRNIAEQLEELSSCGLLIQTCVEAYS